MLANLMRTRAFTDTSYPLCTGLCTACIHCNSIEMLLGHRVIRAKEASAGRQYSPNPRCQGMAQEGDRGIRFLTLYSIHKLAMAI